MFLYFFASLCPVIAVRSFQNLPNGSNSFSTQLEVGSHQDEGLEP